MTRADLMRENEALHGLLAAACEFLQLLADEPFLSTPGTRYDAQVLLAQIKEGEVP